MTNHNEVQNVPREKKHDFNTSAGGRGFIADYFINHLRRHDFTRYINDSLAADFACVLAKHLDQQASAPLEPLTASLSPDPRGVHVAVHQGSECVHAEAMEVPWMDAVPLFWYRPRGDDGLYEGPIHHSGIERVRKESDGWVPLYASPTPTSGEGQEPVAWRHSKTGCLFETEEEVSLADGDEWAEPLYVHPAPQAAQGEDPATRGEPIRSDIEAVLDMLDVPVVARISSHGGNLVSLGQEPADFETAVPLVRETDHRRACEKIMALLAAKPAQGDRDRIATALHYPDHWDTAAYPTLECALIEVTQDYACSECAQPAQDEREAFDLWWKRQQQTANNRRAGDDFLMLDDCDKFQYEMCWKAARASLSTPPMQGDALVALHSARMALVEVSRTGRMNIGAEQEYNSAHISEIIEELDAAIAAMGGEK